MHACSSFFQKVRQSIFLQSITFGLLGLLAFYKTFTFWFYRGWETSWLSGLLGGDISLDALLKSHGLVSYINYLLFGWRPAGWFVTALLFHVTTALLINFFITKRTNNAIGLVSGLLFLVTTAHHDVITWGSFESLYAIQTVCFYLGMWCFNRYYQTKNAMWYACMLLWYVLALIIRESGIIFLPLVLLFDIFFCKRKNIRDLATRHLPIWITTGLYMVFRLKYGWAGHDFIDERVQFRILLFHERRYFEYIKYGLLSFGYFMGPYAVPYPILNGIRDVILHIAPYQWLQTYFFTGFGWITYALFSLLVYRFRKGHYARYLLFSFLSFTAVTIFYSFAWSTKESFLQAPYIWSENRWRYLGFTFFAAAGSIICYNIYIQLKRKNPCLIIALLSVYIIGNTALLWRIEDDMYKENSKPAVLFYKTFTKSFPTLNENDRFYAFRASPLNDFLAELSYTYPSYYPNIRRIPSLWARFEMYYILQGIRQKAPWVTHMHFIDYLPDQGVKDYTKKTQDAIAALAPIDLSFTYGTDSAVLIETPNAHSTEFRYILAGSYRAQKSYTAGSELITEFSKTIASLMKEATLSVCQTMGDSEEPFYDLRTNLALDGTISSRSYWWANCRPAWITIDMGKTVVFSGAGWASTTSKEAFPRMYHYEVSGDGKNWQKVYEVKRNEKDNALDVFDREITGRYLRLWVDETSYRQMLRIDEFFPLFPETVGVAGSYKNVPDLYEAMHANWLKVTWTTEPNNTIPITDTTMFIPISSDGMQHEMRIELLESEFYSAQGQYLRRKLRSVRFDIPKNISFYLNWLRLTAQE